MKAASSPKMVKTETVSRWKRYYTAATPKHYHILYTHGGGIRRGVADVWSCTGELVSCMYN